MDNNILVRVWQEMDFLYLKDHLLIAGDPLGDCSKCKEVGINIAGSKNCPKCGTEFKYIATRLHNDPSQARKLRAKRADLIAIDLSDYKDALGRSQALKFLSD